MNEVLSLPTNPTKYTGKKILARISFSLRLGQGEQQLTVLLRLRHWKGVSRIFLETVLTVMIMQEWMAKEIVKNLTQPIDAQDAEGDAFANAELAEDGSVAIDLDEELAQMKMLSGCCDMQMPRLG